MFIFVVTSSLRRQNLTFFIFFLSLKLLIFHDFGFKVIGNGIFCSYRVEPETSVAYNWIPHFSFFLPSCGVLMLVSGYCNCSVVSDVCYQKWNCICETCIRPPPLLGSVKPMYLRPSHNNWGKFEKLLSNHQGKWYFT